VSDDTPKKPIQLTIAGIEVGKVKTKKPKKEKKPREPRQGGGFFGALVPVPTWEGRALFCPCGRVQVLQSRNSQFFFFDREGPLGDSTLRSKGGDPVYISGTRNGLLRSKAWLEKLGCKIHEHVHPGGGAEPPERGVLRQTPYR